MLKSKVGVSTGVNRSPHSTKVKLSTAFELRAGVSPTHAVMLLKATGVPSPKSSETSPL